MGTQAVLPVIITCGLGSGAGFGSRAVAWLAAAALTGRVSAGKAPEKGTLVELEV